MWGRKAKITCIVGLFNYAVALLAVSLFSASVFFAIGQATWQPPPATLGILAIATFLFGRRLLPVRRGRQPRRVPQSWRRFGHGIYALLFGATLGVGAITEMASLSILVLWLWSASADTGAGVWPPAVAFAAAHVMPTLVVGALARGDQGRGAQVLQQLEVALRPTRALELLLLLAIAWNSLAP